MKIKKVFAFLCLCGFLCCLLAGCAENTERNVIYIRDSESTGFYDSVVGLFPDFDIAKHANITFDLLRNGGIIEAYDVQIENNAAKYWYPLTLETIVIAVDRNRTDMIINSWEDLRYSEIAVGMPNTPLFDRITAAAICYGLDGEIFTLDSAAELLRPLYKNQKLNFNDTTAPIQICFDSYAAEKIKNGENFEIIIPAEGTLSYVKGLLSDKPLIFPDNINQILLEHGLRLADGSCDETIYPASEQYAGAKVLDDYNNLITVTQDWRRTMFRKVRQTQIYTSNDGRENILFPLVFIIIAVIWVGTMMRRAQQKNIRRVILIMGILLGSWVLLRVIKWQIIDENTMTRYLWYGYYIFQSFLPLGLLRIASLIGTGNENKKIPKWFFALLVFNSLLVVLVFTNDLHGMAFKLDLSQPGWSYTDNYSYGFIYYIIAATLLVQLVCGIVLMFTKIKNSPRRFGIIFPLIFTFLLILYIAGYAVRIPLFTESDMTLVMCMFALLFLEVCIWTGQIPVNLRYRALFKNAGLKLQITDGNGNSIFASDDAEPLDDILWDKLKYSETPIYTDDNNLLLKNKISGGYAIWQENIEIISRLKKEIELSNQQLETSNRLLSQFVGAKENEAQINSRNMLYAAFEKNIAGNEKKLADMLRSIPEESSGTSEISGYMGTVAILVCYIKRRFNLLISEMNRNETVSFNEFIVYIDELAELARLTGVQFIVCCNLTGEILTRNAILFYEFFNSVIEWTVAHKISGSVVNIISKDGRIGMNLMTPADFIDYVFPGQIAEQINLSDGLFVKEDQKDIIALRLSLPEDNISGGGENNA